MNPLRDRDWQRLLDTITSSRCVLVLGPDAAQDDDQVPLTHRLAETLLAEANLSETDVQAVGNDLPLAAQLFQSHNKFDRTDLEIEVCEFYDRYRAHTTPLLRNLAALPFCTIVQTTLDNSMETALLENGKKPVVQHYNYCDPNINWQQVGASGEDSDSDFNAPSVSVRESKQPLLYSLFGNIESRDSMVLTESDLLDFLEKVVRGSSTLPASVRSVLRNERTAFLFVGFGFQRWFTRILLRALRSHAARSTRIDKSLALESAANFAHSDWHSTAVFFEEEHAIAFTDHHWQDFTTELCGRFEKSAPQVAATAPVGKSPEVFMCYTRDDLPEVERLQKELQALGITIWRDLDNIRGGAKWERRVKHIISTVDYFLVLQTPNMLERDEAVCIKEIRQALDRQNGMTDDRIFVIPVQLQSCDYLDIENLMDLNRIEVSRDKLADQIAREIKSDWTGKL